MLDEFYMKLNGIVSNIRALGEVVEESYVVKKLLRAVPTKFLQIASTLEQFGNLDTMLVEEVMNSLKAHEERLKDTSEASGEQLMLTEDEWIKREREDGKLLLTREECEEWLKKSNRGGATRTTVMKSRSLQDKSRVKCFNCFGYGHFAAKCHKPRRTKEQKQEINLVQMDDEPALLLAKHDKAGTVNVEIDEQGIQPKLLKVNDEENGSPTCGIWTMVQAIVCQGRNQNSMSWTKQSRAR